MNNFSIDNINLSCACKTFDSKLMLENLKKEPILGELSKELFEYRSNLFSNSVFFVKKQELAEIEKIVTTTVKIIKNPLFERVALTNAPAVSVYNWGTKGVFMGYDFHLTTNGPKLIEINTNAGGALLNAELRKAQKSCCYEEDIDFNLGLEKVFIDMFLNEWKLQRGILPLQRIAVIDEDPLNQYLYPEFLLFKALMEKEGIECIIADSRKIFFTGEDVIYEGKKIDFIYNRLTDFYLEDHKDLCEAYRLNKVVLTPNPHHHALYANKFNLEILTNEESLQEYKLDQDSKDILHRGIPKTYKVKKEEAKDIWKRRKNLFFKPSSGYGSKAAYRGDKITKKVWDEIINSKYVAQDLVPPSLRAVQVDGKRSELKVDIRAYVYDGKVQLYAARLYSGQTTNFRTPGGGFAPVVIW